MSTIPAAVVTRMPKATEYTDENFQPLKNKEAIVSFDGKTLMTSYHYLDVLAQEHAVAFTVAKMMNADMLAEVKSAISDALANGTDFRDFKKRLKPYLMSKGWWGEQVMGDPKDGVIKKVQLGSTRRLRTIYHTNMHTSYAAGQWQRIQKTKDTFPFLQYMPSVAGEPRLDHKKYYGIVRRADDEIWLVIFPPNDYGCLCWVKQLTKEQAEAIGITDDADIEYEDVENPRTGKTTKVPKGVRPSFAHNHDRLSAVLALAEEKHGTAFTEQVKKELDSYMLSLVRDFSDAKIVDFSGLTARKIEVERLLKQNVRQSEAELADLWQQHHGIELVAYENGVHKVLSVGRPADLAQVDASKPPIEWQTLDIMYALAADADKVAFLRSFNKSDIAWVRSKNNIDKHIGKADIVPMSLNSFDTPTLSKILAYVLSLTPEQQRKVVLITGG